jgi:hypothetical protein
MKSEDFARLGDLKNQRFALSGVNRELHAPFTKHVDAPRRLALDEKHGSAGICGRELDSFECFKSAGRKCAKEIVRAQLADQAILNKLEAIRRSHSSPPFAWGRIPARKASKSELVLALLTWGCATPEYHGRESMLRPKCIVPASKVSRLKDLP